VVIKKKMGDTFSAPSTDELLRNLPFRIWLILTKHDFTLMGYTSRFTNDADNDTPQTMKRIDRASHAIQELYQAFQHLVAARTWELSDFPGPIPDLRRREMLYLLNRENEHLYTPALIEGSRKKNVAKEMQKRFRDTIYAALFELRKEFPEHVINKYRKEVDDYYGDGGGMKVVSDEVFELGHLPWIGV
jgi:hypothetical protein